MSGTITPRGKSWRYRIDLGSDDQGRRLRRTLTIPPGKDGKALGKRAATAVAEEWEAKVRAGTIDTRPGVTLDELLTAFIAARPSMSPGTREDWRWQIQARIPAKLRATAIGQVDGRTLDRLYLELAQRGGKGGRPLAPASVRKVHAILSAAFAQAVKWEWIERNPAERATPPELDQHEVIAPSPAAVLAFLEHVDGLPLDHSKMLYDKGDPDPSPLGDFVPLLVATGARPGELCALKVGDVDLETGAMVIRRSYSRGGSGTVKGTKTRKVRTLRIDEETRRRLVARRARLAPLALQMGWPLEELWWFPSRSDPARPWRTDTMGREFLAARRTAGAPAELTMRNLRHFVASVLLAEGVDVRTAAGRLGHGPKVLLGVYAHVLAEQDRSAADVVSLRLQRERKTDGL